MESNSQLEDVKLIVGALYRELVRNQPARLPETLLQCKTAEEIEKALRDDTARVFDALRSNWQKFVAIGPILEGQSAEVSA